MNPNHRFNRDEISKILKHAAELEHEDHAGDDSEGLTLQELEQVSADVGINPMYIQKALDKLKTPDHSITSNIAGGLFSYNFSNSVEGMLKDEDWEDVVSEIRRIHGGIGKTNKMGNTFEWEQRKKEVGYIQISLSPKKDHTKINIHANYNYYAFIVYILSGVFSFAFGSALLATLHKALGFPIGAETIIGGFGIVGIFIAARFYLSHWMKKKRKIYGKLFERFQKMLVPGEVKEQRPSIIIPKKNDDGEIIEKNISSPQQKTT